MAYQPIEMPGFQGFGIAEAMHQARQEQRQKQADAFNQMIQQGQANRAQENIDLERSSIEFNRARQQKADIQAQQDRTRSIHDDLQKIHEAGMPLAAQQLATIYGLQQHEDAQTAGPRVGQLYDNQNLAQSAADTLAGQPQQAQAQSPEVAPAAAAVMAPNAPQPMPEPQAQQPDPIEQAQAQYHQTPQYQYTGPNGLSFTIDPREHLMAQQEQNRLRAEAFQKAFANDPKMLALAPQYAMQIGAGEKPETFFEKEHARQLKAQEDADKQTENVRTHASVEQQNEWHKLAARAAMARGGAGPTPTGLEALIAMKEDGAPDSEIAAAAARAGISPKVWTGPVKEVVRGGAVADRTKERHNQLQVTGLNGEALGEAHSPTDKKKIDDSNLAFQQVRDRYQALVDDIHANGERIDPFDVKATQQRESLMAAAAAAGRVYNQLGVSNANVELEKQILGPGGTLGHGLLKGANPQVIQHALDEAATRHDASLKVRLRAAGGGGGGSQPGGKITTVHMPDGTVQRFDAAGQPVK